MRSPARPHPKRPLRSAVGRVACTLCLLLACGDDPGAAGSTKGAQAQGNKGSKPGAKTNAGDKPGAKGKAGGKGKGKGGRPGGPPGAKGGDASPLAVRMVAPSTRDIVRGYAASGTLEAVRSAQVRPTQAGVIRSLAVEEGETVRQGDVLARLDTRDLDLAARRDRVAASNAQRELERLDKLAAERVASDQEVDQQRYAVASARAAAKLSRHQASQSQIRAPFAGTITSRPLDPGNLVTSADIIYEIADLSTLELALHVPEREAARVELGASVALSNLAKEAFTGKVVRRAPVVDPLTGTVKFTVHSDGERPGTAVPGAFVRAVVELEAKRGVLSVPLSAVVRDGETAFVYVIESGEAVRKTLQLGMADVEFVEVLEGLAAGVQVVQEARDITDGMKLKPFDDSAQAKHESPASKPRAEAG